MDAIIKMIFAYIMSLLQILVPFDGAIFGSENADFTTWSPTDTFYVEDYATIEKNPDEDFVVLNITDVQLSDDEVYGDAGEYSNQLISKMVEDYAPDFITVSGDNATGCMAYLELIELLESFCIPWAPVMGNHEGDGLPSEYWAAYHLAEAEYCLFEFGPEDMGYGNYIVNITENGKIIHTFFMMDTHDNADFVLEDGTVEEGAYDHLWDNQMMWYEWAVDGIAEEAGHVVPSTVIMHIPVYEIYDAWDSVSMPDEDNEFGVINPIYSDIAKGRKLEECCPSAVSNGFFDLCKDLGSTKLIVAGHDHKNDFYVEYEGICLAYGVKSGFGSYWQYDMIGGLTITIDSLGLTEVEQHYYDLDECGFDIYND